MSEGTASLADAFDAVAASAGVRLAVHEQDAAWSYETLLMRSQEISRRLEGVRPQPGQRIALMAPNSAAFVAAFFGIARLGAVVVPLNVRYRSQELRYYLEDARAVAAVVTPAALPSTVEAVAELGQSPALYELGLDGRCHLQQAGTAEPGSLAPTGSPPLLCQYTSGSTGKPKRVVRTHANLLFELEQLARVFALSEGDRLLGAAPFSHVNGLVRTMLTSMVVGAALYPITEFRRREVLDLIQRERITFFGGVPTMFVLLADTPIRGAVDLSSLRIAFSASAPLLAEDNRRFFQKYGLFVRQLYGSTETGTISVNRHTDSAQHLDSVGQPLAGVRVEVLDDAGHPVAVGEEGEVAIASPAAIRSYEDNPEATAKSFRDGFYLSGDLGRKNDDGCLTLTGRKKFLINRGGYKVNPLEVEEALRSHPKVRDVVVLGAPGPHGDEIVRCVVVAAASCTAEELALHCRSRIADFKIPSRFEFRDALPKTETGKILRGNL